jgi:hypothetical protein
MSHLLIYCPLRNLEVAPPFTAFEAAPNAMGPVECRGLVWCGQEIGTDHSQVVAPRFVTPPASIHQSIPPRFSFPA